ncbi:carbohydrate ABC transporter permease [Allocatelliglobosispora scoriae]|uniref:carbohydrate ABC transporter permease n=1 Tax=Allocatelliglobosispora scoriae TaxID=643052 RepID=UPI0035E42A4C
MSNVISEPASPAATPTRGSPPSPKRRAGQSPGRRQEGRAGLLFLSPWLLGLIGITAFPMLFSLFLSFTNYDVLSSWEFLEFVGFDNYRKIFTTDPIFWKSVRVTLTFGLIAVPLKLAASLGVALLLNKARRGVGLYRSMFYLPSLLGGSVALALVWLAMFNGDGAFNDFLALFGIEGKSWINEPDWALATLIVLSVWQFGAPMVIFLAGLKQVPTELYEAASVDGASKLRQFFHVTLPMLSPVIFFNLVLETIHGFQGFTAAFVISNGTGGPVYATKLYTLLIYDKGFTDFQMGYASALAWIFLAVIGLITVVFFSTGRFWVHYSDGEK